MADQDARRDGNKTPSLLAVRSDTGELIRVTANSSGALLVGGDTSIPDLTGTWGYVAGISGTEILTGGKRVVGIAAHCTTAGSLTINGGTPVPIPATTSLDIWPNAQLTDPTLTFTGTDSYVVEYVV